ncbi:MAG: hypothetical protein WD825_12900 [Gemmatimonadaceae bacterium]
MQHRKPATVALTVVAYVLTTFAVQGTSHFAVNTDHFAAIPIMRAEPMVPLGIASMIIQGLIFAWLYPVYASGASSVRRGIAFSWMIGGFLASYIVLAEAGKYAIPSVPAWIAVEASAAFVQYTVFGVWLGLIHRAPRLAGATVAA